ncbi:hypothetical protein UB32_14180 [Mesobacillus subterraneus]|uniref:Uncharacterized protein n=1 Tax=Mesobacillus subterraneus TaxID=285983 RepID=A0A0D6Z709_9BACI|nr:hypothetical protein UB32_14180 [Mesobacillus subterraneus]
MLVVKFFFFYINYPSKPRKGKTKVLTHFLFSSYFDFFFILITNIKNLATEEDFVDPIDSFSFIKFQTVPIPILNLVKTVHKGWSFNVFMKSKK